MTQTTAHSFARIRGVSLTEPAPPVGPFFLTLDAPITVLYGMNGAGKTRLLQLVTAALGGPRVPGADPLLHVELKDADDDSQRGLAASVATGLDYWIAALTPDEMASWSAFDGAMSVPGDAVRWALTHGAGVFPSASEEVVDQVARQGAFVIHGGSREVEPAIKLDELTGPLAAMWQEAQELVAGGNPPRAATVDMVMRTLLDAARHFPPIAMGGPTPPPWASWPIQLWGGAWNPQPLDAGWARPLTEGPLHDLLPVALSSDLERSTLTSTGREVRADGPIVDTLERISSLANAYLHSVLPYAPALRCGLNRPFSGNPFSVVAQDPATCAWFPLEGLSEANLRWAQLAVQLATLQVTGLTDFDAPVLVVDEPDKALHPSARLDLARGLRRLTSRIPTKLVCATHAAELLAPDFGTLVHVQRGPDGLTQVLPVRMDLVRKWPDAAALGLTPVDLLQMVRLFLAVEGPHDAAILGEWLAEPLRACRGRLLSLYGAPNAESVLASDFIFDFTEATVVMVLDETASFICQLWDEVLAAAEVDGVAAAQARIDAVRKDRERLTQGERTLLRVMSSALHSQHRQRLQLASLTRRDILEYLPVHRVVAGATSWDALREESGALTETDFKNFLTRRGVALDVERLRSIASAAPVPDEVQELSLRLLAAAGISDPEIVLGENPAGEGSLT